MARVERLRVFPIKGLDGIDIETAPVLEGGTLKYDREFALFDADGNVINGKRTERVHDLTTDFDPRVPRTIRRETQSDVPEWADDDAFDHYYCSMIVARVPQNSCGEAIGVGDEVRPIRSESTRAYSWDAADSRKKATCAGSDIS